MSNDPQVAPDSVAGYASNISRFYLYRILTSLFLWMPIWVIFFQQKRGLSLTQITLIESVFWIVLALSEIPTGVVADTFGRKSSILIGIVIETGAILLYAFGPSLAWVMLGNVLWGVAISFFSGAVEAFLYDSLAVLKREAEYVQITGRAQALSNGAMALGAVAGGFLAAYDLGLPFLITAGLNLIIFGVVLAFREPPLETSPEEEGNRNYGQILSQAWQLIRVQPGLRYLMGYSAIMPLASLLISVTLLQPHAIALGVPVALLGVLTLGIRGASMIGALSSHKTIQWLGEGKVLAIMPTLTVFSLVILAATHSPWSIAFFAVITFGSAITGPLLQVLIQRQVPGRIRATIMSAQSLLFRLVLALVEPILGFVADHSGLSISFLVLAIGMSFALLSLLILRYLGTRRAIKQVKL